MTREETVKFIYDILKKHSVKVNEVDVIPVSSCIALVDDLIKHETGTLKEFVNRISFSLINDDRVEYDEYIKIMAVIRQDLENFIKEEV